MKFGDPTKVINREPIPLEWMYAGRRYVLEPGQEAMVPWEVAIMYLGNPEVGENVASHRDENGEVTWLPSRKDEIRRLRSYYDNHVCVPGMCNHYPGVTGMADESKVFNAPSVEVYDYTGARIRMIVDDPTGADHTPASQTVSEQVALRQMVEELKSDNKLMRQQLNELLPTGEPDGTYLSQAPGTPDHPVDLSGSLASGDVPRKITLDTDTNLVSTPGAFAEDDLPRDV